VETVDGGTGETWGLSFLHSSIIPSGQHPIKGSVIALDRLPSGRCFQSAQEKRGKGLINMSKRISERGYHILRHLTFERDSYSCILCDKAASEVHHVVPRSQGGRDTMHNLVSVCRVHHEVLHGTRIHGVRLTRLEAQQSVMEYLHDYYAEAIEQGYFGGW